MLEAYKHEAVNLVNLFLEFINVLCNNSVITTEQGNLYKA